MSSEVVPMPNASPRSSMNIRIRRTNGDVAYLFGKIDEYLYVGW